jgi:cell wall-associated NlpC family hydrolase
MPYYSTTAGAAALGFARQQTGVPYVFGGETPGVGFDCSGLTQWAYAQVGVSLPRTTEAQYIVSPISRDHSLEPGDLLFIEGDPTEVNPGHVMIYVSPGQVFQAEETGTLIGQFAYDTTQFEFLTRPALLLPAPPAPTATENDMIVLCTDPHNGGVAVLNLSNGTWYGLANPAVLKLFTDAGVKNIGTVDVATFDLFTQVPSAV